MGCNCANAQQIIVSSAVSSVRLIDLFKAQQMACPVATLLVLSFYTQIHCFLLVESPHMNTAFDPN